MNDDTIAALSTPYGRGGIGIIRISGTNTLRIIQNIIENLPDPLFPRRSIHGYVTNKKKRLDECLVTFFPSPHSYTGEDVAEISIHSNPRLIDTILNLIFSLDARSALNGEFTFRAFKNGRMDLIQAEAVNELIHSNSVYFANIKFGALEGELSRLVGNIRKKMVEIAVRIETQIEFQEDQQIDLPGFRNIIGEIVLELEDILSQSKLNEIFNNGLRLVIVGRANVGKSSLFNRLLREERSIVSEIPGTTRDFIKEKIYFNGIPLEIADVAGIHKDDRDDVEAEGIRRSLILLEESDAVIFLTDGSIPLSQSDLDIYQMIRDKKKIVVINKIDLGNEPVVSGITNHFKNEKVIPISVTADTHIDQVTDFLKGLVTDFHVPDLPIALNLRQRTLMEKMAVSLKQTDQWLQAQTVPPEMIAEEIRRLISLVGELTGEVSTEIILHEIFANFCVGK